MRRIGMLFVTLGLLAAACGAGDGAGDTTTSTTTTTTVPATTTTSPATTTTTSPAAPVVNVYFLVDQPEGGPYLASISRTLEAGDQVRGAVEALLAGPTGQESEGIPAISTAIPAGTELRSLGVAEGQAIVDLSDAFDDGGGSFSMFSRLAQVVYTLTQFPGIDRVALLIEGEPVETFSSEGIEIGPSLERTYFYDTGVLPNVFLDDPAWFAPVSGPFRAGGVARVFEATVNWELYDDDGLLLEEGFTTASEGAPAWGEYSFEVAYSVDRKQVGTLMVFELSAEDGSRVNLTEHPVILEP